VDEYVQLLGDYATEQNYLSFYLDYWYITYTSTSHHHYSFKNNSIPVLK